MKRLVILSTKLLLLCCIMPATTMAQSMMVIGGESAGRDCYMAATLASQMHIGATADIERCTYALDNVALSLKDRVATYVNRGVIYVALERYKEAIADYEKAAQMSPDTGEINVNRGNLYFLGQVYDQAITEYTKAMGNIKKLHVAYYNRGLAYEKLKEFNKAEADYLKAMEIVPDWRFPREKLEQLKEMENLTGDANNA